MGCAVRTGPKWLLHSKSLILSSIQVLQQASGLSISWSQWSLPVGSNVRCQSSRHRILCAVRPHLNPAELTLRGISGLKWVFKGGQGRRSRGLLLMLQFGKFKGDDPKEKSWSWWKFYDSWSRFAEACALAAGFRLKPQAEQLHLPGWCMFVSTCNCYLFICMLAIAMTWLWLKYARKGSDHQMVSLNLPHCQHIFLVHDCIYI